VNVRVFASVNAPLNVHEPPIPFRIIEHGIVTPLVDMVLPVVVDVNVCVPVVFQTVPDATDNDPLMLCAPVPVNVSPPAGKAETVKLTTVVDAVVTVVAPTENPELASKMALSAEVGADEETAPAM
jgi:hypothetical protein